MDNGDDVGQGGMSAGQRQEKWGEMTEMTSSACLHPNPPYPHIYPRSDHTNPLTSSRKPGIILHHSSSSCIPGTFFAPNPLISLCFLTEMTGLALMTWVIPKGHVTGMLRAS